MGNGKLTGFVRELFDSFDLFGLLGESAGDLHFNRATAGDERGGLEKVPRDADGIVEVSLHLVEDVFGAATEEDGAGAEGLSHLVKYVK